MRRTASEDFMHNACTPPLFHLIVLRVKPTQLDQHDQQALTARRKETVWSLALRRLGNGDQVQSKYTSYEEPLSLETCRKKLLKPASNAANNGKSVARDDLRGLQGKLKHGLDQAPVIYEKAPRQSMEAQSHQPPRALGARMVLQPHISAP